MAHLHTYLNDHLAGSVAALDLLDHLIKSSSDPDWAAFFRELKDDIAADQEALRSLLAKVGGEESTPKKALAWLAEKVGHLKLQSVAQDNPAGLHQALEGLSLGITGKRALWRSLAASAATIPGLGGIDYARLEARATEQFARVDAESVKIAAAAMCSE